VKRLGEAGKMIRPVSGGSRWGLGARFTAFWAVIAGIWRLWLIPRYYGWEESDYGNLAMARGVLESGFTQFDMNHLPMYYALSAAVMGVVGDAVIATRIVAWAGGVAVVVLGGLIADRLFGARVAAVVGLALALQPELALYSASALREPCYAAFVMACLAALTRDRLLLASSFAGLAFLTRMDALLTLSPALLLHALGRGPRLPRVGMALLPLIFAALAWSTYCHEVFGTWAFWEHSVSVNIETGGAASPVGAAWVVEGLKVDLALITGLIPSRVGFGLWLGGIVGLGLLPWTRHDPRRSLGVAALGLFGFWLGIALTAQHEPGHNLYWKWLYPVLPPMIILAVHGGFALLDRVSQALSPFVGRVLGALAILQGLWVMMGETDRQVKLSEALYKPQWEIALFIEGQAAPGDGLLVDNIPAAGSTAGSTPSGCSPGWISTP
jgi:4-amino-4-deoxy-L-arabinose transferase-like glycosyltransferase